MITHWTVYTGGNTSTPRTHRKPRSRRLWSLQTTLSGHRIAYFRVPESQEGGRTA